ncbi:type VI secretion system-associated FHA domain protein TagH [Psychromonas sp. PT13]|uniref:type VI secretion system-associated FHA domain protein TagH n=1 Tax=Psychromonas sp. PT13 TaxID=3439547 RepID=UPI003EB8F507
MAVNFKITSYHRLSPEQVTEFSVETSAVFGRSNGADWCLPDPEKVVSGSHVRIDKEGDDFYLYDISTNGVFINRSVEPLGDSGSHKLCHDDLLSIGDYEITVELLDAEALLPESDSTETLLDEETPVQPHIDIEPMEFLAEDLLGSDKSESALSVSTDLNDSFVAPKSESSISIPEEWDFSSLVDEPIEEDLNSIQPESETVEESIDIPEQTEKPEVLPEGIEDVLALPEEAVEALIIPEEIEEDLLAEEEVVVAEEIATEKAVPKQAPQPKVIPVAEKVIPKVEKVVAEPVKKTVTPRVSHTHSNVSTSQVKPQPIERPQVTKPIKPAPAYTNTTTSSGAELDMFLEGLGLSPNLRKESMSAETYYELGQSMNLMFMGLIKLLRNRALLKSEFKINQTTFQQKENNPLKFSATIDDVFNNLYLHGSSSFLSSDKAIKEAFSDTEKHDKALSAGTLGALLGVLDQLSPEKIQENNTQEHYFDKLISSNKHARNWDLFIQLHDDLKNDISTHGSGALTDEFVKAYDEKIKSL